MAPATGRRTCSASPGCRKLEFPQRRSSPVTARFPSSEPPTATAPSPADERLAALVRDYGHLIARAVARTGGQAVQNDRDDIAQAVRVALWKRLASEQTIDHPASYVYKAAVRETVRAVTRVRNRGDVPLEPVTADAVAAPAAGPEAELEARERREVLAAALGALPPERARAVKAHLAGFSVEELMQLRGWSYQRARNLIARGMADLREQLRSRGMP